MGMFDYINYKGKEYQTKDTPAQGLDHYEIRDDGTLWYEMYDAKWVDDPNALFGGYIDQHNKRWVPESDFVGEIRFYNYDTNLKEWDEYSAYFVKGVIKHLEVIRKESSDE